MSNVIQWGKDLIGDTSVDPKATEEFLKWWFRADDIVALRVMKIDGPKISLAMKRDDLISFITTPDDESGKSMLEQASEENRDVYVNVCHVKEEKEPSKTEGVKSDDIKGFRGVFADIDCGKTGAFSSPEAVVEWVESLDYRPSAIVRTGSGGVHLWWKTTKMEQKDFSVIQKRWWSYLNGIAPEGVSIDRLWDVTRIARLPGATRHPKKMELRAQVTVTYTDAEPLDGETFTKITETPYKHLREDLKKFEAKEDQILLDMAEGATPTIGQLALREALMSRTADLVTWEEILEGAGWRYLGKAGDGSDKWERPGGHGKSANTGYPDERSAMSLHSADEGTGLADLKAQEIKMSKWRVFLRLTHNDDVRAAELDILEREMNNV